MSKYIVYFFINAVATSMLNSISTATIIEQPNLNFKEYSFHVNSDKKAVANKVRDNFYLVYSPIVESYGANLEIELKFESSKINAQAYRSWDNWIISVEGGLIFHPGISELSLIMVMCHELAHHIGGAPKKELLYASSESQADYWASAFCMKNYLKSTAPQGALIELGAKASKSLEKKAVERCESKYGNALDKAICLVNLKASLETSKFLNSLRKTPKEISFLTPDLRRVERTNVDYANIQCRLDTFYQGSLCSMELKHPTPQRDEVESGCMEQNNHLEGRRPACWYKPFSVIPH